MPNTPWGEFYIGSDPGVPLEEAADVSTSSGRVAGARVPVDGWLDTLPQGSGFDLGVEEDQLKPFSF